MVLKLKVDSSSSASRSAEGGLEGEDAGEDGAESPRNHLTMGSCAAFSMMSVGNKLGDERAARWRVSFASSLDTFMLDGDLLALFEAAAVLPARHMLALSTLDESDSKDVRGLLSLTRPCSLEVRGVLGRDEEEASMQASYT